MIFESLLSDDDSITLIQNGGENSHFQNADNTYLSVSNELDISNNQAFSATESCYLSDSEIEINLAGSAEEGRSSDREQSEKLQQDLASWTCYNRCSKLCLDELLVLLRRYGCVLPKDARTLLKTPISVENKTIFGGSYVYLGIAAGLRRILGEESSEDSIIELSVNINGVPLYKSASTQLWPILCQYEKSDPFLVAIYCGITKPKDCNLNLQDFLDEYCNLKHNGFFYNDKSYKISIRTFVCDAPARQFLKNIRSHNSHHGCERCTVKGVWEGRVVFDGEFFELRSEERFNAVDYEDHQNGLCPLVIAGVLCIKNFPIEYMHLVCLRVVKRMLLWLNEGPLLWLIEDCRLLQFQQQQISDRLNSIRGKMPSEFARQPRDLLEVKRWKATEF